MDLRLSGPLERALAQIPERQRAALLLAELHDLTGLELAAAMGVSHVAARAILTRARASAGPSPPRRRPRRPPRPSATHASQTRRGADDDPAVPQPAPRPGVDPRSRAGADLDGAGRTAWRGRGPWLAGHLETCAECSRDREVYAADQALLRALRETTPEPPRDLWARTAAAIDHEAGGRRRIPGVPVASRGGRQLWRGLPIGAAAGALLVVVVFVTSVWPRTLPPVVPPTASDGVAVLPSPPVQPTPWPSLPATSAGSDPRPTAAGSS